MNGTELSVLLIVLIAVYFMIYGLSKMNCGSQIVEYKFVNRPFWKQQDDILRTSVYMNDLFTRPTPINVGPIFGQPYGRY